MNFFNKLPRWVTWGFVFPLIFLNGWLLIIVFNFFQPLITIVIVANLLAFILDYPVKSLTKQRVKRQQAVIIVFLFAFLIIVGFGLIVTPIIIEQLNELAKRLPSWIDSGSQQLDALNDWAIARKIPINLKGIEIQLTQRLSSQIQDLTGKFLAILLESAGSIFNVLLTLVITFYFLLYGEELWDGVYDWLPQPLGQEIRIALRQNFHNYYIGQASLAAIIGISMIVTFSVLGLPFGLLFGLGVGFMALFPFGAGLSITVVSVLMALNNLWLGLKVLVVAFVIEQIIENAIAPRLLGGFIGLNPVWILISLLIGAKIAGILGILIAVPMAGFIKSLALMIRADKNN